ncbi:SNF2 family helicase Rhp26 [Schizosaccharomyces cryophilus OY26]|uniref:SNF2 family helicase Rhp26 n=1 Tax=Schizosaccharomyces cryophilus (strain OY26 / ATCC MYA-4695 / CBS 11777 / NBRC 106824 / NRRL Y48691) TaxID=653667 RepID=S9VWG5_SCHCR|nr:SNF2 family helicase Rhp26 [Schizosaccharomyces cryophilus OY26]EPY50589.1 SNF2 family helicase Rhp26 [Schizosaccharomyces cryophilus OY26]
MESNQELTQLGVFTVDQASLERDVTNSADQYIASETREIEKKRLEKVQKEIDTVQQKTRQLEARIDSRLTQISVKGNLRKQLDKFRATLQNLKSDENDIKLRMEGVGEGQQTAFTDPHANEEVERQELIRTGKITPFGNFSGIEKRSDFHDYQPSNQVIPEKHEFAGDTNIKGTSVEQTEEHDDYVPKQEEEEDYAQVENVTEQTATSTVDDGDDLVYRKRLHSWCTERNLLREKTKRVKQEESETSNEQNSTNQSSLSVDTEEWFRPHPTKRGQTFEGGFTVPGDIRPHLFRYQVTCVQWLWELYSQEAGGIIGDEMGLGKTIQIVSFLSSLHHSRMYEKPALIVCPATLMKQWVNEFHQWWGPLRVVVLHATGSGALATREKRQYRSLEEEDTVEEAANVNPNASKSFHSYAKALVDSVFTEGHVLITTYAGLRLYSDLLLPREWGYCVLDEGHKIRNPDSEMSVNCKQVRTPHRIILSGTPIQNNLIELWNLFDFVFPGRLGTLPVFQNQFALPINIGGYANASNVQVQTAYKCACMLRDLISPYLLRRMKLDVAADLPKKSEQVLFCKLTPLQRKAYQDFLNGSDMQKILNGKRQMLYGIDILRKICNHPDLVVREFLSQKKDYHYGDPKKSGKLEVVNSLLQLWKKQKHRTLLFSQTRQMLDILENSIKGIPEIRYCRMDGGTSIGLRQGLVDNFNKNDIYDVFLLTTRVGGLGINLTGADRVILFDPDWNPSTDAQARERAWRLGQKKDVVVYRLMTAGTIEEKIYHRQIFKQFLTNKILKDPKQRRFFKMTDLHDLFSLGNDKEEGTETGNMFLGAERVFKKQPSSHDEEKSKKQRSREDVEGNPQKDKNRKVFDKIGIASIEKFKPPEDSGVTKPTSSKNTHGDESVLDDIFASAGIQSTLKHDEIMEASQPETLLVEKEASKVANDALRAVANSRRQQLSANRNRAAPPSMNSSRQNSASTSSKASGPVNSSTLLARLKQRR